MNEDDATDGRALLQLFPDTASLAPDGSLTVGDCRLDTIAEKFHTPVYVVDELSMRRQARRYVDGLERRRPGSRVAFASKSFPCRAVYRLMADEGLLIDVAGGGELVMALDAGVDPSTIVLHGNAKTNAELRMALDAGVGTIVIDGLAEITRLARLTTREQRVLLRVQPGVDARTQAAISTGHRGSKFGVPVELVPEALDTIEQSTWLRLDGLHLHLGSQMLEVEPWREAIQIVAAFGGLHTYDLGGGLGVQYTRDQPAPTIDAYLDTVTAAAKEHLPDDAHLVIEPGRSLVAQSTVTVYRVVTVKTGDPTFVAVDGGMADNFEASTYVGQRFEATMVDRVGGGDVVELVGRQCESGDRLASSIRLNKPAAGDLVVMPMTGAYTHTLANNYNGALRPAVIFCREGIATAVVRRDTYDDLLAREIPWPHGSVKATEG
ncbi:MAG: diaminopimelate decarboxylase [Candidatus Nanopelagicales bacterium]